MSPDSQLKYLKRAFDQDLIELARTYATARSVIWDVGANCGVFAFSASMAKQVVAVEADPFLCHLLQLSAYDHGRSNVTVLPVAVSDAVGIAEFAISARGRASNHLVDYDGRSQTGGKRGTFMVPTITLDVMLETLSPPTFVKIDVEGAEAGVLRGASRLLSDVRPTVYIEVGRPNEEECRAIFERQGYAVTGSYNWLATPL